MTEILKAENITFEAGGRRILDIENFSLPEKKVTAVMGHNGAGKSTLLKMLSLIEKPKSGRIFFRGIPVDFEKDALSLRRKFGAVFQEPLLFDMTVLKNAALGLVLRGVPKKDAHKKAYGWLERLGVEKLGEKNPKTLSGGEAQRVSLARAFALEPEILFLDEPFSALDYPAKSALIKDINEILTEKGTTAFFVTHDRDEALQLSDFLGFMVDGKIIQYGRSFEVAGRPLTPLIAEFMGNENILKGEATGLEENLAVVDINGVLVRANCEDSFIGEPVYVIVRPEVITLIKNERPLKTSARNLIRGEIARITKVGFYADILLDCGFLLMVKTTLETLSDLELKINDQVFASFKASSVHLIKRHHESAGE